jgi:rhodanese-related sulfurtransferase
MKCALLIVVTCLFTQTVYSQKQFVCLPCGQSCDGVTHTQSGKCSSCNMILVEKHTVKFKDIGVEEFCKRISENKDVVILDVRTPEEFSGKRMESFGHFKNAINININELEQRIDELASKKTQEVLVYCSHSHRSPRASYLLGLKGFTNVKNLEEGVSTFADLKSKRLLKEKFIFHED